VSNRPWYKPRRVHWSEILLILAVYAWARLVVAWREHKRRRV
jgi:hypothetical protein